MSDRKGVAGLVEELVELVRAYVMQETVDPLRNLGRSVGLGILGSLLVGIAVIFFVLAVMRLLTGISWFDHGLQSTIPYLVAIVAVGGVVAVARRRRRSR